MVYPPNASVYQDGVDTAPVMVATPLVNRQKVQAVTAQPGLPIIAEDKSGLPIVADDKPGLLVTAEDKLELIVVVGAKRKRDSGKDNCHQCGTCDCFDKETGQFSKALDCDDLCDSCTSDGESDDSQDDSQDNSQDDSQDGNQDNDQKKSFLWVNEGVSELGYLTYQGTKSPLQLSFDDSKAILSGLFKDGVTSSGESFEQLLKAAKQYLNKPKPREIVVRWNFQEYGNSSWRYNTNTKVDLLPFLITQLDDASKELAIDMLHPAPNFGSGSYPSFNYELDTLSIYYGRCGVEEHEAEEYWHSIQFAVNQIAKFYKMYDLPALKRIKVTFCTQMINKMASLGCQFASLFNLLKGLRVLELDCQDHNRHPWEDENGTMMPVFGDLDDTSFDYDRVNIAESDYSFIVKLGREVLYVPSKD